MGRKVNPKIFRIPLIRDWDSKWFAKKHEFKQFLKEDIQIREFLAKRLKNCGISNISIERLANILRISISTAKPGLIIGRGGLDIEKLMSYRKETGKTQGFPGAEGYEDPSQALEFDCDILVPAALENQITRINAPNIKAKIIAEGANGPTTATASEILLERGAYILPDMFLNAGGVTVSYFEWIKNLSHVRFGRMEKRFDQSMITNILKSVESITGKKFEQSLINKVATGADELDLVRSGLEETMIQAYNQIYESARTNKVDLRTAAFINSIDKIAVSYQELGIFP